MDRPGQIRRVGTRAACATLALGLAAGSVFAAGENSASDDAGLRPTLSAGNGSRAVADSAAGTTGYVSTGEASGHPKRKQSKKRKLAPVAATPPDPVASVQPGQKMNPRIGAITETPHIRKKPPEDDPFGPVGFHAGAFLVKPSVEVSEGYDNNPFRVQGGPGSAFTTVNAALSAKSEWSRHEMQLDLRGSYTTYQDVDHIDRPDANASLRGKIDVTSDTRIEYKEEAALTAQAPGTPNSITGAKRLPFVYILDTSTGLVKQFNRLELGLYGEASRYIYEDAELLSGGTDELSVFNYNDYTVRLRGSYEVTPGMKPFVEVAADTRKFDQDINSFGLRQGSNGYKAEAGVVFDRADLIKGQIGLGYMARSYDDPTLPNVSGLLIDSSLIWKPSALTQVKFDMNSAINESVATGAAGIFTREAKLTVDHWFRRWLMGSVFGSYAQDQYRGTERVDDRWAYGAALTYWMNRMWALRGEYRHEALNSNISGQDYRADVVTLGLRMQR